MNNSEYDYTERPKQFERDDFWRQVRRTVNGEPIAEAQIRMIVGQIVSSLQLEPDDRLLDIGCGNGALSVRLEPHIGTLLGFDRSQYLIEIANEHFASSKMRFEHRLLEDALARRDAAFGDFNKCLLYGVAPYLADDMVVGLVRRFFERESGALMLGNERDRNAAAAFFGEKLNTAELDDTGTSVGKWRTQAWYEELAADLGVQVRFFKMPPEFYAAKRYFDVVFTKG